jgi:5'-nucleotidase
VFSFFRGFVIFLLVGPPDDRRSPILPLTDVNAVYPHAPPWYLFRVVVILVSNDDGIRAAGILALEAALTPLGEVWVVAPDREQSATSHSLSLHRPLRVEKIDDRHFAVDGTPTDAVNLAINGIMPKRPDLVVSGINHGANLGDDITYSGTVSAAIEGTLLNVPSIAVSLVVRNGLNFEVAAAFAAALARAAYQRGLPADTLLNVNVPGLPRADVRGHVVTRMGKRRYGDAIVEKLDPRGKKYYWIGGEDLGFVPAEGTDFTAVESGYISITPLHLDLTNYASIAQVSELQVEWP